MPIGKDAQPRRKALKKRVLCFFMLQTSRSLPRLDDQALRERFTALVANDRQTTADLLRCIDEIDRRKLWAEDACGSLLDAP